MTSSINGLQTLVRIKVNRWIKSTCFMRFPNDLFGDKHVEVDWETKLSFETSDLRARRTKLRLGCLRAAKSAVNLHTE